jgi:hypothetical protein
LVYGAFQAVDTVVVYEGGDYGEDGDAGIADEEARDVYWD